MLSQELGMEGTKSFAEDQMRTKWESLHQEFSTKQKLLQNVLEQEKEQVVSNILFLSFPLGLWNRVLYVSGHTLELAMFLRVALNI